MRTRYFAYGSNLKLVRMRERVPSAWPEGTARLPGYRLVCDKAGADGSGKANLRADSASEVWGAIYSLDSADWVDLDAHELGYERLLVEVSLRDGKLRAHTYLSPRTTPDPIPFAWYKRLIIEGAREHALPDDWIRTLEAWPERADP